MEFGVHRDPHVGRMIPAQRIAAELELAFRTSDDVNGFHDARRLAHVRAQVNGKDMHRSHHNSPHARRAFGNARTLRRRDSRLSVDQIALDL